MAWETDLRQDPLRVLECLASVRVTVIWHAAVTQPAFRRAREQDAIGMQTLQANRDSNC